jgi:hypothetical protein
MHLIVINLSRYVKGKMTNVDSVLVDIGTGYFVEKVVIFMPYFTSYFLSFQFTMTQQDLVLHRSNDILLRMPSHVL